VLLAVILLAAANSNKPPIIKNDAGQPLSTPRKDIGQAGSVAIKNFSFQPETLNIKVGDSVVWTNEDNTVHDIVSGIFKSPLIKSGESFTFTFDKAGSYDYACGIHPSMKGRIIVE